jgi:hypothetical protein
MNLRESGADFEFHFDKERLYEPLFTACSVYNPGPDLLGTAYIYLNARPYL